jgi:uncharacterized protein
MLLKVLSKKRMFSLLLVATQIVTVNYAHADIAAGFQGNLAAQASYGFGGGGALAGSGYWGGTQACPYKTKTSKAAVDVSDEEKRERQAIKKLQKEVEIETLKRDRAEKKLELVSKKLEKFFDASVYDFVISHMDKTLKCNEYREFPANNCPVAGAAGITAASSDANGDAANKELAAKCGNLPGSDVPDLLKNKWIKPDGSSGSYCAANSDSSRGLINASICSDTTLKPADAPKYRKLSSTECSRALSDYRKTKLEYEKAQALVERKQDEADERTEAIADARELAKLEREYNLKNKLEGSVDCEECNQKPQRDWWSTIANVAGGLGLAWYGKKIDESAQEYNAQLGFPSTNSYGYPFVTAGVYSVINGLAGPGAYGCGGGIGGAGFPYGGAGAWGPYGTNGYGPFSALGGAFGYPQSMYGSPWGGGAYNPGLGFNGSLNGPNGGWPFGLNGQFGVGVPVNGQIGIPANGGWQQTAMCITWPCPGGTAVGGAIGGIGNGQIGIPASGGWPTTGYMSNGYMANGAMGNYQLQMLQQQQAMLQMQAQQQAQLAQYYQMQAQQQMIAYQRQQAAQQEAMQVQQVIASLQARLNMIYSNAGYGGYGGGAYGGGSIYGGGSGYLGGSLGGIVSGGIYFGAASATIPGTGTIYNPTYPIGGAGTTLPGTGTGGRGR